jgi:hypothetical protein
MTGRKPLSDAAGEGDPVNPPPETVRPDVADTSDRTDKTLTGAELLALAEATGELPPDPFPLWTDYSGAGTMPDPGPLAVAEGLARVLAAYNPDPVSLIVQGRRIVEAARDGQDLEQAASRPATIDQTISDLAAVESAAADLIRALERVRAPGRHVLAGKAFTIWQIEPLTETLKDLQEATAEGQKECFRGEAGGIGGDVADPVSFADKPPKGRPEALKARTVTEAAALAFMMLTRKWPTFTTDALAKPRATVRGLWPELLAATFKALNMNASVENQVRRFADDNPPDTRLDLSRLDDPGGMDATRPRHDKGEKSAD